MVALAVVVKCIGSGAGEGMVALAVAVTCVGSGAGEDMSGDNAAGPSQFRQGAGNLEQKQLSLGSVR